MKPSRIAIVADYLEEGWPSMDLVAESLLSELQACRPADFTISNLRPRFVKRFRRFSRSQNGNLVLVDRLLNRFFDYPRFLESRKRDFDLFHIVDHSYSHLAPAVGSDNALVTCHDLDAFRVTGQGKTRSWLLSRIARRVLSGFQSAAAIACDSVTVRDEVLRHGLIPAGRLSVNPNGVARCFRPEPDSFADAAAIRLLGNGDANRLNILHVGSTIPRKCIDLVLHSFATVRRELPQARLIRVGGSFTPAQRELMKQLDLAQDTIVELPFLSREVLAAVYRHATVTLLPSQSEGFGLPVVESMACGTPVVLSDIAVFREVAGDTASFCPVGDVDAYAHAVLSLISERQTRPRLFAERCVAGVVWATQFTWESYAQRAAILYRELVGRQ